MPDESIVYFLEGKSQDFNQVHLPSLHVLLDLLRQVLAHVVHGRLQKITKNIASFPGLHFSSSMYILFMHDHGMNMWDCVMFHVEPGRLVLRIGVSGSTLIRDAYKLCASIAETIVHGPLGLSWVYML